MRHSQRAFTLIELMIVVAIIGILAAIAIPKFANLIRKSSEGATRGQLGAIRSAITIYYSEMEGLFPTHISSLTANGKYLTKIPTVKTPNYHADSTAIAVGSEGSDLTDVGGWIYANVPGVESFGEVYVNCTHTDSKGTGWSEY